MENVTDIPLYWSEDGRRTEVVRCHQEHIALRKTFEEVGGCPYCSFAPSERVAALRAKEASRWQASQGDDH